MSRCLDCSRPPTCLSGSFAMSRRALTTALAWGVPVLALLMLGLTCVPASVWRAPADDAVYSGFDPNLVMVASTASGGSAQAAKDSVNLKADSASVAVNLATTQLQKLNASFDVTISSNQGASDPFRIGVWSPWTASGEFMVFGAAPVNPIVSETLTNGQAGPTLLAGDVLNATQVGNYQLGRVYHVLVLIDRSAGTIAIRVRGDDGTNGTAALTSAQLPAMFGNVQLSLSAFTAAEQGSSRVVLSHYELRLPHQSEWASRISDPVASALLIALAMLGVLT